jgi:hypothetical protein
LFTFLGKATFSTPRNSIIAPYWEIGHGDGAVSSETWVNRNSRAFMVIRPELVESGQEFVRRESVN